MTFNLANRHLIDLPKIHDPRGNLTFIEGGDHIPLDIQRVYYLYDVPGVSERGGHAHKGVLHQLIITMSRSFDRVAQRRQGEETGALPISPQAANKHDN